MCSSDEQMNALLDMFAPEPLDEELVRHLRKGLIGKGLFHPLIHDPLYHEMRNKQINALFRHKKEAIMKAISEGRWSSMLFLHERPYRVDVLSEIMFTRSITDPETIWPLVANAWIDSENIHQNIDEWREIWDSSIPLRSELVMDETERGALAILPDTITVFRGVGHHDAVEGMSWTTNKEKAKWFARRFSAMTGHTPLLAKGTVKKAHVIAHFLGRGESEIVVFHEDVIVTDVVTVRAKQ